MFIGPEAEIVSGEIASGSSAPQPPTLLCRRITESDVEAAVNLLSAGFPERDSRYWRRALDRLRSRDVPDGYPRYGYVLTDKGRPVGIALTIFSETGSGVVRGNVSSWYVQPYYRGYSHLLLAAPVKLKNATLINASPAPTTVATISAQGFVRYVDGTFIALAALAPPVLGVKIRRVTATDQAASPLLQDHARWGCLTFEVTYAGETFPFVFVSHRILGGFLPCAVLIYCREIEQFRRFAGPLGRYFLRRGLGVMLVDANAPLDGIPGLYRPGRSTKFCRGQTKPRLGDLSYTEQAVFGP